MDLLCLFVVIEQTADVDQILIAETFAKSRELAPYRFFLLLACRPVNWNELTSNFQALELLVEFGDVDKKSTLIETSKQVLQVFLLILRASFITIHEVVQCLGSQVVAFEPSVDRIAEKLDKFEQVIHVVKVKPESISLNGIVEVPAVDDIPDRKISSDLS